jgi:hypothetical protein
VTSLHRQLEETTMHRFVWIPSTLVFVGLVSIAPAWADDVNLDKMNDPQLCCSGGHDPKAALNPQPLPPGITQTDHMATIGSQSGGAGSGKVIEDLNPQPLPPGRAMTNSAHMLNPQPLPPGQK